MRYVKFFSFFSLMAIALLGNGLTARSQDSNSNATTEQSSSQAEASASSASREDCFSGLATKINELKSDLTVDSIKKELREEELRELDKEMLDGQEEKKIQEEAQQEYEQRTSLQSKRVELYYYRNAENIVSILSKLPLEAPGCVTTLPLNDIPDIEGKGVGRGGGNIISLYGTKPYIENAQRFITSLDLPLPGIDLQLWGVQISSKDPDELAETMSEVRWRIGETKRLLGDTLAAIEGVSQFTLQEQNRGITIDFDFRDRMQSLGYEDAIDGLGGKLSILEIFLVGLAVDNAPNFYQDLYNNYLAKGEVINGKFVAENEKIQPYFDALKDTNRPPFERTFRSRGLEPYCAEHEKPKQQDENEELKCEKWKWKPVPIEVNDSQDSTRNLPIYYADKITANYGRKVLLEFGLHYTDFINNPNQFDPEELQRTASALDELLQSRSDMLQKDIEDFFIKPTLKMIQEIVAEDDEVEFAQVGRSTISTLNGVETTVNTKSTSGFQISQSQDLGQLLSRAEELQGAIAKFLPTGALGDGAEVAETAATGVPVSRLLGLAVAAMEQNSTPLEIQTGTNLAFTPGISRNLNSAELNINLTVTDPVIPPTAAENGVPPISRIGKQTMNTTIYTQALDFFDLSTFTSQASLDGGRARIPIIGNIWNAIFGAIPGFGDLFSTPRGNQNVYHESLILTSSFITPTPLSLGNLYSPNSNSDESDFFCQHRTALYEYLNSNPESSFGGQATQRNTKIITDRCEENT